MRFEEQHIESSAESCPSPGVLILCLAPFDRTITSVGTCSVRASLSVRSTVRGVERRRNDVAICRWHGSRDSQFHAYFPSTATIVRPRDSSSIRDRCHAENHAQSLRHHVKFGGRRASNEAGVCDRTTDSESVVQCTPLRPLRVTTEIVTPSQILAEALYCWPGWLATGQDCAHTVAERGQKNLP